MARAVAMTSLLRLGCRLTSPHPVSTFAPIATSHSVSSNWSRGEQFWHLRVPVVNVHIPRRQQQRLWRCMSSGGAHEDSGRMPARLVQKQKELDALPEYEDLDQPIPKISLGFDSRHLTLSALFRVCPWWSSLYLYLHCGQLAKWLGNKGMQFVKNRWLLLADS